MAIAFGAASFLSQGSGTSSTPAEPASAVSGDVLVGICVVDAAGTTAPTRPSGWTNIYNAVSTTQGDFRYDVSYIVRGGSAPALNWTWTGSAFNECHVIRLTGAAASPLDASPATVHTSGTGAPNPPSITPTTNNALILIGGCHWTGSVGAGGWVAPANYTRRSNNTVGNDVVIATRVMVGGAGVAEDPAAFTTGVLANEDALAFSVAFKEAAGSSAVLTGTAIGGITEGDIVGGGKTIIITLTGDTFIA